MLGAHGGWVEEGEWDNMSHAFVDPEIKEVAKETFGFKSVPHYVVADQTGQVRFTGGVKAFRLEDVPGLLAPLPTGADATVAAAADALQAIDITDSPTAASGSASASASAPAAPAPAFTLDEDF